MATEDTVEPLRLIALDEDDLQVISAHVQDSVMLVADMEFFARDNRFVTLLNRFDWEDALEGGEKAKKSYRRRRTGLHFNRVLSVQTQNIRVAAKEAVLELLAIKFDVSEAPAGHITLVFAGGGAVRLEVECIEAQLSDLGPAWETVSKPEHSEGDD